jgi:hypothetical protein
MRISTGPLMMHFSPRKYPPQKEDGYTSLHRALVFARTNKAIVTAIRTVQSIMTWVEERDRYPPIPWTSSAA